MIILGGDTMHIGCINIWPEGAVIFRGQGATGVRLLRIIEQRLSRDEMERVDDMAKVC